MGDKVPRGQEDKETGGQGDKETESGRREARGKRA